MTSEISTPLPTGGQERHATATFPVHDPARAATVIGLGREGMHHFTETRVMTVPTEGA